MSSEEWVSDRHVVIVGPAGRLEAAARAAGAVVREVDLGGISTTTAMCDRIADVLEFPYPSSGVDGVMDLISDLEWLDEGTGFLLVFAVAGTSPEPIAALAGLLPFAVDRWRGQSQAFVVVIDGAPAPGAVLEQLEEANVRLDDAGALSWARPGTGRVPVRRG